MSVFVRYYSWEDVWAKSSQTGSSLIAIFRATLITLHVLSLQRSQMPLSSCLMSGCVCYVDGNLPAEHNYGKFLQLVMKCTELVTTGGFSSVASAPLSHSEKWRPLLGKHSSFDSAYFVAKISWVGAVTFVKWRCISKAASSTLPWSLFEFSVPLWKPRIIFMLARLLWSSILSLVLPSQELGVVFVWKCFKISSLAVLLCRQSADNKAISRHNPVLMRLGENNRRSSYETWYNKYLPSVRNKFVHYRLGFPCPPVETGSLCPSGVVIVASPVLHTLNLTQSTAPIAL